MFVIMLQWISVRFQSLSRTALFLAAVSLAGSGFAGGWFAGKFRAPYGSFSELRLPGYRFINPLLDCEMGAEAVEFRELKPFQHKIEQLIEQRKRERRLIHVSVYFRDLMNGPWFGIGEKELFTPSSLLKLPIMIACLKQAEQDPSFLKREIAYAHLEDLNRKQLVKPEKTMTRGKRYTVEELIQRAIVYSDNNAAHLLGSAVDQQVLLRTFRDLGVETPRMNIMYDFMTVKMYASFFRVLFNASYLNREMSQKALQYLAFADYRSGLAAGLPDYVLTAHKFGEHSDTGPLSTKQLHDCGIVYLPGHPYLLCVMSRGTEFGPLEDVIREVSMNVYTEVERQAREGAGKEFP